MSLPYKGRELSDGYINPISQLGGVGEGRVANLISHSLKQTRESALQTPQPHLCKYHILQ